VVRSFAIITTAANREMAAIYDSMPLVLKEADWLAGWEKGNRNGYFARHRMALYGLACLHARTRCGTTTPTSPSR
jgi:hypothetical protein